MKLQTRKRIFYVFILLFVVIGAAVVLYAEGWRLNLSTLEAEKAGGIYVRSYPDDAQIALNGKSVPNQSAFLSRGTFISGLFPKTYTLQLSAAGYDAWTENTQVVPSLVAEMKYAVLVPKTATNIATTTAAVSDFFETDGQTIVTDSSATISWLGKIIGYGTVVSHSADLRTAVIRTISAKTGATTYSFYDFTTATSTNLSALLRQSDIRSTPTTNVFVDPYDDTNIITQTPAQIVAIDSDTHRTTVVDTAPAGETIESPIAMSPSVMAWARYANASDTSQIVIYDKFSGDTTDDSLRIIGPVKQLAWVRNDVLGILASDNTLYLYNVPNEQLSTLAKIPILIMFGDHLGDIPGPFASLWPANFDTCNKFVGQVNAAGGDAKMMDLPKMGIKGNSHMLMQDKNNLQLADLILGWIDDRVEGKNRHK